MKAFKYSHSTNPVVILFHLTCDPSLLSYLLSLPLPIALVLAFYK